MKLTLRLLLCLPLLWSVGCQTVEKIDPTSDGDVADMREAREEKLISDFEASRTEAQFLAAMASWEHGDTNGAKQSLEALLLREPTNRDARLLLADLLAESGATRDAENHLRLLIGQDNSDAQAHFALGLLLETDERTADAMEHFQLATRLEPGNELYTLTAQAIGEQTMPVGYAGTNGDTGCGSGCQESGGCSSCSTLPASYNAPASYVAPSTR